MHNYRRATGEHQTGADLHNAPRIRGRDDFSVRLFNRRQLLPKYFATQLGMLKIIDARSTTAIFRSAKRDQFNARNRLEQVERLAADALRMQQVTGRVVSDSLADWDR